MSLETKLQETCADRYIHWNSNSQLVYLGVVLGNCGIVHAVSTSNQITIPRYVLLCTCVCYYGNGPGNEATARLTIVIIINMLCILVCTVYRLASVLWSQYSHAHKNQFMHQNSYKFYCCTGPYATFSFSSMF